MIHPTAVIDSGVELAEGVSIGAFSVLKGRVKVGARTKIESHVTVGSEYGTVEIGEDNWILPGASIGGAPQDLSYKGEPTALKIGRKNVIREFVTLNIGTQKGGGVTRIGDENLLMAYVHLGHDCHFGNNIVVANSVQFAGHVEVDDFARIGGMVGIAQFCRVGRYAYIGGHSSINKDMLPFAICEGNWAVARATNKIGLERAGFSKERIEAIHRSIRTLTKGDRTLDESVKKIEEDFGQVADVQYMLEFIRNSKAGIGR